MTNWECGNKKNGLIFYFWPRLFDITHDESHCGKRVGFRGIYCCLGGPIGPPWSKMAHMGPLVTYWKGGKIICLILDFRPRLPDITLSPSKAPKDTFSLVFMGAGRAAAPIGDEVL